MNKCLLHIFFLLVFHSIKAQGIEKAKGYENQYATIIGLVPKSAGIDSVCLFLYPENTSSDLSINITGMTTITSKVINGRYSFNIAVNDKLLYFSLYKIPRQRLQKKTRLLYFHLVEKGDYVVINHFGPKLTFSGMGAAKHNVHVLFSNDDGYEYKFDNPSLLKKSESIKSRLEGYQLNCEDTFSKIKRLLQLLDNRKLELSEKSYQVLYCEIIGYCQYSLIRITRNLTSNRFKIAPSDKDAIRIHFKNIQKELSRSEFSDSTTASSIRYIKYNLFHLDLRRALEHDTAGLVEFIIKSTNKSELRDKLLISVFGLSYKRFGKAIIFAVNQMHNQSLKHDLLGLYNKQKKGANVPDNFWLIDENNSDINLSSYKGKVIFLDFWYVGCAPCADYYKTTVSVAKKSFIDSKEVVFITVCTEKEYKSWIAALESEIYTSKSAVNLFTGGVGLEHPLIKYFNVMGAPTPILIDKNFKVFCTDEILLGRGGNSNELVKSIKLCINF